jgi:hypothetical protein
MKYKALFWQNYQAKSEEFDTLKKASDFLIEGEGEGSLSSVAVFDGEKLHDVIEDGYNWTKHKKQDLKPFGIGQ